MRIRTCIAGALVTVALLLALGGSASAEHRTFRVGVNDAEERFTTDLPAMGRSNVEVARVNFSWSRVEQGGKCDRSGYQWGSYDQIVGRASANGVPVLPVIVGSPRYVASESARMPNTAKRGEIEPYKCFVRALVDRYGRGGELPTADPRIRPVTAWQVWNEPNLPKYATEERGVDAREYARLVEVSSREIRRIDSRATIALAGLPYAKFRPEPFLRSFYRERGIEGKFDAVSLHPYAETYRGVKGAVLRARELLRRVGDRGRYLWITETGWATHGGGGLDAIVTSPKGQAQQLSKTFDMLRRNRREWNIGTVAWFRWRDTASVSQDRGAFDYTGLYSKGGKPKPSCRRFVSYTGGTCQPIP